MQIRKKLTVLAESNGIRTKMILNWYTNGYFENTVSCKSSHIVTAFRLFQVHARDVNKFQLAYCNLLKSHMDGLKKHKKVKVKKNLQ